MADTSSASSSRALRASISISCFSGRAPRALASATERRKALSAGRLLPASQNALRFHERIAYDDSYQGAADHVKEGERLASVLEKRDVLLLAQHGVVVAGPSVAKAFDDLYFLERAAKVQVLAQATGGRLRSILDDVARGYVRADRPNNLAKQAREHFAALLRILDREEPDYRD